MKVLILSCSTGEGHNSTARALSEALSARNVECETIDHVALKNPKVSSAVSGFYNGLIKKTPAVFGGIYKVGEIYDNLHLPSPVYGLNSRCADELYKYAVTNGYSVIVSTHLFGMETCTAVRRKYAPSEMKFFGVLTDYTVIPFFEETELDGYFVPAEEMKAELAAKGVDESKIFATGIPVSPKFSSGLTKEEARRQIGADDGKKVVVIMSGGVGCGKIARLAEKMSEAAGDIAKIFVLTGKNDKLRQKVLKVAEGRDLVAVPFTTDVDKYIRAADVVLSKPGGLSSTEIAACRVPLVHLKAIPGCETKNVGFFSSRKMSLSARNAEKAVNAAMRLLGDSAFASEMIEAQKRIINPDSADKVAEHITKK